MTDSFNSIVSAICNHTELCIPSSNDIFVLCCDAYYSAISHSKNDYITHVCVLTLILNTIDK